MTKKQKKEIEKYFKEFNALQNTLEFSFESDGKTIKAQGYTKAGGDYPFEYYTDYLIPKKFYGESSLKEDSVEDYLFALVDNIYDTFDPDEEIRIWSEVEQSKRNGMNVRQLCHDIEDFDEELGKASDKIKGFILDKKNEKERERQKSNSKEKS